MFAPSMDRFQPPDDRLGPECEHKNCVCFDDDLGRCTLSYPDIDGDECFNRQDVCPKCLEAVNENGRCEICNPKEETA